MFCEPKGQELNTFIWSLFLWIFWRPWDPWERVHIDLNKNSVRTGCVKILNTELWDTERNKMFLVFFVDFFSSITLGDMKYVKSKNGFLTKNERNYAVHEERGLGAYDRASLRFDFNSH